LVIEHLRPTGKWQQLKGVAHGLRQPALTGELAITALPVEAPGAILAQLPQLLAEAPPDAAGETRATPEDRVAKLFAWAVCAVQRQHRIAVDDRLRVERMRAADGASAQFRLWLPSHSFRSSRVAVQWTLAAFNAAANGALGAERIERLREGAQQHLSPLAAAGLNRSLIVAAALRLDIPVAPFADLVIALGTGRHVRWMNSTITDRTPSLGVSIAKQKHQTARVLREAGLPGGVNQLVDSKEGAVEAAHSLGWPVVVKPADRDKGEGVAADLRDDESVAAAYEAARECSKSVLVEKWVAGHTHRLTVFEGSVVRVVRRVAGGVRGDGVHDVAALVQRLQSDAFHLEMARIHGSPLVQLDEEALGLLKQQGRAAAYVPAAGEHVRLRRRDNVSAGGTNEELDAADPLAVHPDNVRLALDAARLLRLDFAGVDLIIEDIARSWLDIGGLVCEVNAQPQIGTPRIYDMLLPAMMGPKCCIPAELFVCAAAGRESLVRELVDAGRFDVVADASGLRMNGMRVTGAFPDGFGSARAALLRPEAGSAACIVTPLDIVRHGLPLSRWDRIEIRDAGLADDERAALPHARAMAHADETYVTDS
jgi:cyanophycin synthetase